MLCTQKGLRSKFGRAHDKPSTLRGVGVSAQNWAVWGSLGGWILMVPLQIARTMMALNMVCRDASVRKVSPQTNLPPDGTKAGGATRNLMRERRAKLMPSMVSPEPPQIAFLMGLAFFSICLFWGWSKGGTKVGSGGLGAT